MARQVIAAMLVIGMLLGVPGVVAKPEIPPPQLNGPELETDVCKWLTETAHLDPETCKDLLELANVEIQSGSFTASDLKVVLPKQGGDYDIHIPIAYRYLIEGGERTLNVMDETSNGAIYDYLITISGSI